MGYLGVFLEGWSNVLKPYFKVVTGKFRMALGVFLGVWLFVLLVQSGAP